MGLHGRKNCINSNRCTDERTWQTGCTPHSHSIRTKWPRSFYIPATASRKVHRETLPEINSTIAPMLSFTSEWGNNLRPSEFKNTKFLSQNFPLSYPVREIHNPPISWETSAYIRNFLPVKDNTEKNLSEIIPWRLIQCPSPRHPASGATCL